MTNMTSERIPAEVGVAQAKSGLSGLLVRVAAGERFLISRRGRIVAALVPPDRVARDVPAYLGLAAFAGYLEEWDDIDAFVAEVYADRERTMPRPGPDLG
jgi:antitoxin (DNA-binding transcriptional repressor) of toxin-antitoxin stability system